MNSDVKAHCGLTCSGLSYGGVEPGGDMKFGIWFVADWAHRSVWPK